MPTYTWNRYFQVLALSWITFMLAMKLKLLHSPTPFAIFGIFYMWIPGFVALWAARQEGTPLPLFKNFNIYWIFAPLVALALGLLSIFPSLLTGDYVGLQNLSTLFPATNVPSVVLYLFLLGVTIVTGCTVNALAALGEELFWRGYLWHNFKDYGFWISSYLTGILWGIWHMPLIYFLGYSYPGWPLLGSFFFILFCVLLSPFLSYFREKGKSIIPAALFHGMINATPGLTFILFKNLDTLWVGLISIPMTGVLFLLNGLFYFFLSNKTKPHTTTDSPL